MGIIQLRKIFVGENNKTLKGLCSLSPTKIFTWNFVTTPSSSLPVWLLWLRYGWLVIWLYRLAYKDKRRYEVLKEGSFFKKTVDSMVELIQNSRCCTWNGENSRCTSEHVSDHLSVAFQFELLSLWLRSMSWIYGKMSFW